MESERRQRGFSLMEVLVVLSLTGVVLGMVATLVSKTYETMKFLQEKSQTMQSATLGLERLSSEFREAVGFTSFTPLLFQKVNPVAPEAVGADPADFVGFATWNRDYGAISQIATVEYSDAIVSEKLIRNVTFGGNSTSSVVANAVNAFQVTRPYTSQNSFQIVLTLQEKRRLIAFTTVVTVPGIAP
jgi:prepilin-type N-terminal cleavage/methylation domain-containing protein